MIKLNYAKIDSLGIVESEIESIEAVKRIFELSKIKNDKKGIKVVYWASVSGEVFVSDSFGVIYNCVLIYFKSLEFGMLQTSINAKILHIHEYPSFEEAYKSSLYMMEENELCYSESTKDSPYWNKK